MNLREIDRLIDRLNIDAEENAELITFYERRRAELLRKIYEELIDII